MTNDAPDDKNNPLLTAVGLPPFGRIRPEHIRPAVSQVLADARTQLEDLSHRDMPSLEWLRESERLLERVHDVWHPVSHLNSVASTPELREAYNECLTLITEFYSDLGQNERLYDRFRLLSGDLTTGPESELVRQCLRDFELSGVALSGEARDSYRKTRLELAANEAAFEQNLMDATDAFSYHELDEKKLAGLPAEVVARARSNAQSEALDGWLLKLDPPTYMSVMSHANEAALRERYYRAWVTRASDLDAGEWNNGPLLETILRLRQRAAELLGFPDFAALSLAKKIATSEEQVLAFLEDLAARSRQFAESEFAELESFAGRKLDAWDVAWYSEKLRQKSFNIGDEELRAYFPLPKVLEGMFDLTESLFGIRIRETRIDGLWHESARSFDLESADGDAIGVMLTDFYARPNKRGGAWMDTCTNRSRLGTLDRNPVAHLVCNFAQPAPDTPSYLTHRDVITLFHEFGHSLHHLLTEIDYPSIAGINGVAWDAVELPSQFFENYAWLPEVLKSISAHRESGEQIPDTKIATLIESRTFQAGLAMMRQLEYALFDFRLHARNTPASEAQVQLIANEVRAETGVVPVPEFNRFQCSFSHIFGGGYAAGYYSYKWAEVLAADAFAAFEDQGAVDRSTASRFRKSILAVGGSRDAMESFVEFRGREPSLDPLLRQAGIAA